MSKDKLQPKKIILLETARRVLAEKGHGEFSMRSLAREAGVHLRTVQYYFPKKRDLLNEVMEYTLGTYYLGRYATSRKNYASLPGEKKLETVIGFLYDDMRDPFVCKFFPEVWAMASRDQDATDALDNFYTTHRRSIAVLVAEAAPNLSEKAVAHRAAIISMLIEGLLLLIGAGKPSHNDLRGLKTEVLRQVRNIILLDEDARLPASHRANTVD